MARVVINTIGSTGDLLPFIALAQGLQSRGHSVVFAASASMHKTVRNAGIEAVACGHDMSEADARQKIHIFDGSNPMKQLKLLMFEWLIPSLEQNYRDLMEICKGADALVATTIQFAAPMVQQKLGLHWISVSLNPCQFPSAFARPMYWPLGGVNRFAWWMVKAITRVQFLGALNRERARLGFGPLYGAPTFDDLSPQMILLACSQHFSPRQPDWDSRLKMPGFWFYDGKEQSEWQPGRELEAFMARGEKPVVLSLGSMVQRDPARVVRIHADAAAALKQRLVIQQGWAQLSTAGLEPAIARGEIIGAGFLPHEWLFSNAAAVIHHGGSGTTARALRHGCPMLVEPHGFDQPFNARTVEQLGVGRQVPAHKLNVKSVTRALERILTSETKARAEMIAGKIRAEDGVGKACEQIEACLSAPQSVAAARTE